MRTYVGRELAKEKLALSNSTPTILKFHLIENGEHFLVISKIERATELARHGFDGNNYFNVKNKKYSIEDLGKSSDSISNFPLLEITFPSSVENEDLKITLSPELRKGILGLRGEDHTVSLDLLKRCITKKRKHISRNPQTDLYCFDTEKNRVLNLVAAFNQTNIEQKHINILTVYYPSDNVLKYRLNNCSDTIFEHWKKTLTEV
ncbi:MAG: hypothetical protein K1000chlam2_01411 [Chlamydiae bacterium]|nr:hypothetical protein [Chlamydiota bacterium]